MPTLSDAFALGKPRERLLEHRPVVDAGNQHDLDVELDPRIEQLVEPLERPVFSGADELLANRRVDRVQRHVERREVLLGDALDVLVGEVGERDEVALEEGQAVVVVAQVERAAEPLWAAAS